MVSDPYVSLTLLQGFSVVRNENIIISFYCMRVLSDFFSSNLQVKKLGGIKGQVWKSVHSTAQPSVLAETMIML